MGTAVSTRAMRGVRIIGRSWSSLVVVFQSLAGRGGGDLFLKMIFLRVELVDELSRIIATPP